MNKYLLLLICCLSFSINSFENTLFKLSDAIQEINEDSDCAQNNKGNPNNICSCCLIQQIPQLKNKNIDPENIVKECIQKKLCTPTDLENLLPRSPLRNTLLDFYDRHSLIKIINTEGVALTSEGRLTAEAVRKILTKAFELGKLTNPDFKDENCLSIDWLGGKVYSGTTSQIFEINSKCSHNSYILKRLSTGQVEATKLALGAAIKELRDFLPTTHKPGFPILIFPVAYISYIFENQRFIFSLMPKADGTPLGDFLTKYISNPSEQTLNEAADAYKITGKALAQFHKKFLDKNSFKSILHADLHQWNILVNEKNQTVYLIDNENIANKFNNRGNFVSTDIFYFYRFSTQRYLEPAQTLSAIQKRNWVFVVFKAFLTSYLDGFDLEQQQLILNELHSIAKEKNQEALFSLVSELQAHQ